MSEGARERGSERAREGCAVDGRERWEGGREGKGGEGERGKVGWWIGGREVVRLGGWVSE